MTSGSKVTVKIPATTANLGPGFDCLGMALDLWSEVTIEAAPDPSVEILGFGSDELAANESNLVYQACLRAYKAKNAEAPHFKLWCKNGIPLKRGLGSSGAAIVGGLFAGDLLSGGSQMSKERLLSLAVELEGHPDNVAASVYGGLRLVAQEEAKLVCVPVPFPEDLHTVVFIPVARISTEDARAVLPDSYSRADAVYNAGRTALLVNAMTTGRMQDLAYATQDRIHQPYRQSLFRPMKVIFEAAMKGGALGVFLSGSGSTILALTQGREMTVAYEMAEAARQCGAEGEVKITRPSLMGVHQA